MKKWLVIFQVCLGVMSVSFQSALACDFTKDAEQAPYLTIIYDNDLSNQISSPSNITPDKT